MDEYLSEKEQIERIRQWWSDYGWYLIGGVAIGLLALFGYGRYQSAENAAAESAAALYSELAAAVEDDDLDEVERTLTTLRSDFADSPYTANGSLMLAKMVLVSDPNRAIEALRAVMDEPPDEELAMIARLRLARVLAWQEQYDAAIALLDVPEPGAFSARLYDIRGDILLASGDSEGAQAAYASALVMPGSDALDRSYLQMKLSSVIATSSGNSTATTSVLPEVDLNAVAADPAGSTPQGAAASADDGGSTDVAQPSDPAEPADEGAAP